MSIKPSFKPLRKLLVDRDMKHSDLYNKVGISRSTATSISQDRYVSLEIIAIICEYFDCRIEQVIEFVNENLDN